MLQAGVLLGARRVQRLEVDQGIAPGHVRVSGLRRLVGIGRIQRRLATGLGRAGGSVVHPLDVGLPRVARRDQLARQGLSAGRVHAAVAQDLPLGGALGRRDVAELGTVELRLDGRALAAEQRDPIGQLALGNPVVVGKQLALLTQRVRQVGEDRVRAEGPVVALAGQHHHEHMLDRRQARGGAGRSARGSASSSAAPGGGRRRRDGLSGDRFGDRGRGGRCAGVRERRPT